MKDMLPAPYEDRVMIPDGTPPGKRAEMIHVVAPAKKYRPPEEHHKPGVSHKAAAILEAPQIRVDRRPETFAFTLIADTVKQAIVTDYAAEPLGGKVRPALAKSITAYLACKFTDLNDRQIADRIGWATRDQTHDARRHMARRVQAGQFVEGRYHLADGLTYAGVVEELERKIANAGGRL